MPVSCHFRDCKAQLSGIVSGAISSELALPLLIHSLTHSLSLLSFRPTLTWFTPNFPIIAIAEVEIGRTLQLLVLDLLVYFRDETLYVIVFAVGNEVGDADWLLSMRLRSRHQPQPTYHTHAHTQAHVGVKLIE